ncbi:SDR family oxidoreductase [Fodinibius salsisoli]|uniref:SDR family oxidoreductase n=1 Tax=Fodinibius salsisoli TaxID=2820877 RepID=A0ABT3PPE0_9BACT|nr:SDR family oxidoreductase [Fodinibius salsisoli]MCW9707720.1 SDR family oxidoreductase [Fodinibius salsisoli]
MSNRTLKDKVIVVGAGAKNLGGLISRTFAQEGANIAVHYHSDSTQEAAQKTVAAVKETGSDAFMIQGDLTKPEEIAKLFDAAIDRFGKIDIAINTVGKVLKKPYVDTTEEEFDSMFDINAKAAYFFIQEAGKRIDGEGSIITIVTSLLAAFTGLYSTYAGGKAPVEHFARAAAKEFGSKGISVANVAPGPMDTPFFYPAESEEAIEFHKSQSMNGKLTNIEDIVPIIKFLATDGWWITGQTIFANGGYTTR